MKEYRGAFDSATVLAALSVTKIEPHNQKFVLDYLVDGVRLKDLPCKKQQAYARIKKVVELIKGINP